MPFNDFYVMNTTSQDPVETKVYLLWDDQNLYVGYENFDGDMGNMIVGDVINGWWASGIDDSVETHLAGSLEGLWRGFFANPNEVKFIYNKPAGAPLGFNAEPVDWAVRSIRMGDRWNLVEAIPFSSIEVDVNVSKTLYGLFFRNYHENSIYLSWKGGAPWTAAGFSPVKLIESVAP